jgi:hypothetical protein
VNEIKGSTQESDSQHAPSGSNPLQPGSDTKQSDDAKTDEREKNRPHPDDEIERQMKFLGDLDLSQVQ